ncbi:serine hydrolase domain-containing protein [Texcoconibacillus texcoconensis]|uniref:CubicO group peptidase (Beta-lactamase class C family) n=1 Tax=Texcoconibacillus texcoconensis TaxID=1095777 RepID=A0A840QQP0_9BACI|nr:serine hydrolase [Texcoconibacillus texcoconensis]MBB5173685.1 CubicO group peptidase (beta-lactamase class C family) [Texcoconibacillus texcoconensis]
MTSGDEVVHPHDVGMDEHKLSAFKEAFANEPVKSWLISKNGKNITNDQTLSERKELHTLNSITKSILSILIGKAVEQRYISSIQVPLQEIFPQHSLRDEKKDITIEHLLTMTSGLQGPERSDIQINDNLLGTIFDQPLAYSPGEKMTYNNHDSHVLSAIIREVTGMNTDEYAHSVLFEALEIEEYAWKKDRQGTAIGGFGLKLNPYDLLRIGNFMLQKGKWKNEVLLSNDWIEEATKSQVETDIRQQKYGYHWWINNNVRGDNNNFYYAAGRGGNFLFVVPDKSLVAAFTGEFNAKESLKPYQWFVRYILPAFE